MLQKNGPSSGRTLNIEIGLIDDVVKDLTTFYEDRGATVIILSEYGISEVDHPIHVNRLLNEAGYISTRRERNGLTLDCGASRAFALADHQIAIVHVANQDDSDEVEILLKEAPGIEHVFRESNAPDWAANMFHGERCGTFVCVANKSSWFTYYFWSDTNDAPDYAPTVAIHEKPVRLPELLSGIGHLTRVIGRDMILVNFLYGTLLGLESGLD